ncbi:MAG: hypothetical protein WCO57_02855 [Verrucomicrobiota bacterium]
MSAGHSACKPPPRSTWLSRPAAGRECGVPPQCCGSVGRGGLAAPRRSVGRGGLAAMQRSVGRGGLAAMQRSVGRGGLAAPRLANG